MSTTDGIFASHRGTGKMACELCILAIGRVFSYPTATTRAPSGQRVAPSHVTLASDSASRRATWTRLRSLQQKRSHRSAVAGTELSRSRAAPALLLGDWADLDRVIALTVLYTVHQTRFSIAPWPKTVHLTFNYIINTAVCIMAQNRSRTLT